MMLFDIENLKEDSRPPLYRALKYWGKKPHNIWRELILNNTDVNDTVYDPFAGSALTFFESIKLKRKPVVADINPLTLFLIEVYSKDYNIQKIIDRFEAIEKIVDDSDIYKKNYKAKCSNCSSVVDIYNYRNFNNEALSYSYRCKNCSKVLTQLNDKEKYDIELGFWKPDIEIKGFSSTCNSSIKSFGGSNISNVWTKRNLEILSYIFELIKLSDKDIQYPLMFAFLQTLHLTTKMCALRSEKSNRPLSTSWGRPAYMFLNKNMEQNPLIQFRRSIFEKNGLIKALESRKKYLPEYTFSTNMDDKECVSGVVLIKDSKTIDNFCVKLIITDPPYGSIIQYGELSAIWNVWLENFSDKYRINLKDEIIIKKDCNYEKYINDMTLVLSNCRQILSKDGLMIMTYNSNSSKDWESINKAIENSNLNIKFKYMQKNKRSSEANVIMTSELANSDYYFILDKSKSLVTV